MTNWSSSRKIHKNSDIIVNCKKFHYVQNLNGYKDLFGIDGESFEVELNFFPKTHYNFNFHEVNRNGNSMYKTWKFFWRSDHFIFQQHRLGEEKEQRMSFFEFWKSFHGLRKKKKKDQECMKRQMGNLRFIDWSKTEFPFRKTNSTSKLNIYGTDELMNWFSKFLNNHFQVWKNTWQWLSSYVQILNLKWRILRYKLLRRTFK